MTSIMMAIALVALYLTICKDEDNDRRNKHLSWKQW